MWVVEAVRKWWHAEYPALRRELLGLDARETRMRQLPPTGLVMPMPAVEPPRMHVSGNLDWAPHPAELAAELERLQQLPIPRAKDPPGTVARVCVHGLAMWHHRYGCFVCESKEQHGRWQRERDERRRVVGAGYF